MKFVYVSFYFPPDFGAGAFRSFSFLKVFLKKIDKSDEVHLITTHPNRYKIKKKFKTHLLRDKRLKIHRIKLVNHKEKFFLKSLSGLLYFINALSILRRIKPDLIISSSARMVSGLIAFTHCKLNNCKYFLDLRDLFSILLKEIYKKNLIIGIISDFFFYLEKKIIVNSISVNLISPGFKEILMKKKALNKNLTFFTNGYDKEFQKKIINKKKKFKNNKILYAGNIGHGQDLEKIIPQVARKNNSYIYEIIGDGGKKDELSDYIKSYNCKNVKLLKPIKREILIKKMQDADILFINLANLKILENVIPSKLFEYILFKKPIVAGFKGFIKKYSLKNFDNIFCFNNSNECYQKINKIFQKRNVFFYKKNINKFNRELILSKYVDHILKLSYKISK